ncbi:MAG: hypothetical protein WBF73_33870 [Bradyrhizobium sp.]
MDRWFLLGGYGPRARFHMIEAWTTLIGLFTVDMVWLSFSRLSFADDNWNSIIRLALFMTIAFGLCGLISHRLAGATDRVGRVLREGARRVELFAVAMLLGCSRSLSSHIAFSVPPLPSLSRMRGWHESTNRSASTGSPSWNSSTPARWQAGCWWKAIEARPTC